MKVGLILECGPLGPDEQVCRHLAGKLLPDIELSCDTLVNKKRLIVECGNSARQLLEDGCERVVIVWDLRPAWPDKKAKLCRHRERELILETLAQAGLTDEPVQLLCIETELEAWLLADERALTKVLSRPTHPANIPRCKRPEKVPSPKSVLIEIFQQHGRGRYNDMVHALKIAQEIEDWARLRQCASFVRFAKLVAGSTI